MLLLHGSAGTSAIWRAAKDAFSLAHHVIAPDLIGYGKAPSWPDGAPFSLGDELSHILPTLPCCDRNFHVVGYSYGGALAVELARANPVRIKTLTLVEPVFFAALRYAGDALSYATFAAVRERFAGALAAGQREAAMRDFIEFWIGPGSWDALSPSARLGMLQMTGKIKLDWEASFAADPGIDLLQLMASRTLLVRGDRSPEPMLKLVDGLHRLMPGSSMRIVQEANHLLPITHKTELIEAISAHWAWEAERRLR